MILSFASKALEAMWVKNNPARVAADLRQRIMRRLNRLDVAERPEDMNLPGFDFHGLSGTRNGTYSVHVNGPWCLTFRWEGTDAIDVDLENYH